mmetsp:Transcript_12172/g.44420  ORF Transcript_12172/g.44420 Transcript_12172/m.44420 type:complete len:1190 (+) Transcript_12172:96-3665(+)
MRKSRKQQLEDPFEESVAGAAVTQLVSRGHALIAELLRISSKVPKSHVSPGPREAPLILDFKYFKQSEFFEEKVENSAELVEADDELRESSLGMLTRFFLLFEGIAKFHADLCKLLKDLDEGLYIQHSLQTVLTHDEGRQLLVECVWLLGVLLILVDLKIPGIVRERMVVSYYRYKGQSEIANIDTVCSLCRATGYVASSAKGESRPAGYPEKYFARFPVPKTVVQILLSRLRSDDLYHQMLHYPAPEHRSCALSPQMACVYVMLYFIPEMLSDATVMREIADKFLSDQWMVCYYTGFVHDLRICWDPYKAAKTALQPTLVLSHIKALAQTHQSSVKRLEHDLDDFLTPGVLSVETLLGMISKVATCLRDCNVSLRWLLLHRYAPMQLASENGGGMPYYGYQTSTYSAIKRARDAIDKEVAVSNESLVHFVLSVSHLEFLVKSLYGQLLERKQEQWDTCKQIAARCVTELAEYFSGSKVLAREIRDDNLQRWFTKMAAKIAGLDENAPAGAGRKIQQLISALEEVEQFHQIDSSAQIKEYLTETRQQLYKMLQVGNISSEMLTTVSVVSDASYMWHIFDAFTPVIHQLLYTQPQLVLKLRSMFMKIKSMIDLPIMRIAQAESEDLLPVSQYYSGELEAYVRSVLEIIPVSIFKILSENVGLINAKLKSLPTKLEKDKLKDFAQLDQRYQIAAATNRIAAFSKGMLAMDTTFVGIIELKPRNLLEDGIRKELVKRMSEALHHFLQFGTAKRPGAATPEEFGGKLQSLGSTLEGIRGNLEYIQDYIKIQGLQVWQEEFKRTVNFYVEQEVNAFVKRKVEPWESQYNNDAIPFPLYPPTDSSSVNFMGRLTRELLLQTHPSSTMYIYGYSGWFDQQGNERVGIRLFETLRSSVGVAGLLGIDRVLCFIAVKSIDRLIVAYRNRDEVTFQRTVGRISNALQPWTAIPKGGPALYREALASLGAYWERFTECASTLGQVQLLRRQIAVVLSSTCTLESNNLSSALESANRSVLTDVKAYYKHPEGSPYPSEDSPLLPELCKTLEGAGLHNPIAKIYVTTDPFTDLPLISALFTLTYLSKYNFDPFMSMLVPERRARKQTGVDICPLVVGILSLLKQLHGSYTGAYIRYLAQYVCTQVAAGSVAESNGKAAPTGAVPVEAGRVLIFLEELCRLGEISRDIVHELLPPYIFDMQCA